MLLGSFGFFRAFLFCISSAAGMLLQKYIKISRSDNEIIMKHLVANAIHGAVVTYAEGVRNRNHVSGDEQGLARFRQAEMYSTLYKYQVS